METETARICLGSWHDVSTWLDYVSLEFVCDATTRGYLEHVAQCVREEAERRFAEDAGLVLA